MDTQLFFYFISFLLLLVIIWFVIGFIKNRQHTNYFKRHFPPQWIEILNNNFDLYQNLPLDLQIQLHGHINVFLAKKNFVGYNGIVINDTIRVVIAAQACLLLLNRKTNYYPHLTNILIYPNVFTHAKQKGETPSRLGESWHRGPIVLSWKHSHEGGKNKHDGNNVIVHEFAHQLDQENNMGEGLPELQSNNVQQWSRILGKEFKALKLKLKFRKKSFLDKYGATNPAEFFAVITEHFIEQPKQFNEKHPELYIELKKYYQINPIEWV